MKYKLILVIFIGNDIRKKLIPKCNEEVRRFFVAFSQNKDDYSLCFAKVICTEKGAPLELINSFKGAKIFKIPEKKKKSGVLIKIRIKKKN